MRGSILIPMVLAALVAGCATTGYDRDVVRSREAILQKYPDVAPADLRLSSIDPIDHAAPVSPARMVTFEQVSSVQVTTNEGTVSRSVRHLDTHVAPNGGITSVGEGRSTQTGPVRRLRPAPACRSTIRSLNKVVSLGRRMAAKTFQQEPANLRLFSLTLEYATNGLSRYHVQFFDPHSVQPNPEREGSVDAVEYGIMLAPDGSYLRSTTGRGIGWTE